MNYAKRYVGRKWFLTPLVFVLSLFLMQRGTQAQEETTEEKRGLDLKTYEELGIAEFYKADFELALQFLQKVLDSPQSRLSPKAEKAWGRLVDFSIESYLRTDRCEEALDLSRGEYQRLSAQLRDLQEYLELTIEELQSMLEYENEKPLR